ncbi:hypothetical protein K2173_014311 [Erythroxylum novogranatense]|uniref:CRM domain-containing protein n=1 Tax=Erythroxylum novogranatense TaxID=1862640 RepID=A0AAV8SDV6_9ROSI|nr:hypothetical protein K2173_014311 [Erythroxylum novogranatense]
MFAARNLRRHCFKALPSLFQSNPCRNATLLKGAVLKFVCINGVTEQRFSYKEGFPSSLSPLDHHCRFMSTSKGRSMRSKVERRMRKESSKTLKEIRRAKKLKKKLMTDEERLIYNLKRAKKKVALLLQKLKKYELPELPPPIHDPEPLTPEQLHAYRMIGLRNKNYVIVGTRGVFGGVVQNMHLHWKFHETVQVHCDNFPKEKIKEMAMMLVRLSGGIVVDIHNVKTIIMFRGRNYRQPKNLIPINTLTKRKALFKARFEQALESQKLNIKKIEQQLRRMGVNPEDPVAMASIQRVAATFFNAIDKKEGSPYVFQGDTAMIEEPIGNLEHSEPHADSDQEELDRFIAEIEAAADKEFHEEEAAEKEEFGKIRYWNREDFGGRRRHEMYRDEDSDAEDEGARILRDVRDKKSSEIYHSSDHSGGENEWDSVDVGDASDLESESDFSDKACAHGNRSGELQSKRNGSTKGKSNKGINQRVNAKFSPEEVEQGSESDDMLSDLDNAMWESDDEEESVPRSSRAKSTDDFRSDSDEEENYSRKRDQIIRVNDIESDVDEDDIAYDKPDDNSDSEVQTWDAEERLEPYNKVRYNDGEGENKDYNVKQDKMHIPKKVKTPKEIDESWESD